MSEIQAYVDKCVSDAEESCAYFVKTLSFVPDEKLNYSPSDSARSALQLAAHVALSNGVFAGFIRGENVEFPGDIEDFREWQRMQEASFDDRTVVVDLLKHNTAEAVEAMRAMTPDLFATSPVSPFGAMPMAFWMNLVSMHMNVHASQVDYLQTIWGDLDDHF